MEKREFLKRLSLSTFAFPMWVACAEKANPITEGSDEDATNSADTASDCTLTNSETAGPYPTHSPGSLVREDIRADRTGVALDVELTVLNKNQSCLPLVGALIDIWHCDKDGNYSEYSGFSNVSFLRGRQTSDENGKVAFTTIFPGWYNGRATHIHLHVFDSTGKSLLVSQIAFPEGSNSAVVQVNASAANGYTKGMNGYTYNAQDNVFGDGVANELANISGSVSGGYSLTHSLVVSA